jgi:hypothetical protein
LITQTHVIAIQNGIIANTIENIIVEAINAISIEIQDGTIASSIQNVTITQVHSVSIADGVIGESVSNIQITQVHKIEIENILQSSFIENVQITQQHNIVIENSYIFTYVDNVIITTQALRQLKIVNSIIRDDLKIISSKNTNLLITILMQLLVKGIISKSMNMKQKIRKDLTLKYKIKH